ncbi:hypothetical protein QIS74_04342 [Colletotrichum tabaci]|uniref:Uncharacterized protein n=1 Tax=Colletotrichum tabaci TaxID=1209068 RepID=A0AAV9TKP6_9PEZI
MIPTHAIKLVPILASAAYGLQFTGPDTNTDLNLSAPITVSWEHNVAEADASWTVFDLSWHGDFVRSSSFSYTLQENITVSTGGQYEWDPAPIRELLVAGTGKLSSDKAFYFAAKLHSPDAPGRGSVVQSAKYAVEDGDLVESPGNAVSPSQGFILLSLVASIVLF